MMEPGKRLKELPIKVALIPLRILRLLIVDNLEADSLDKA
jgi:hypothetical protein